MRQEDGSKLASVGVAGMSLIWALLEP
jgi:hypothetical protein